MHTPQGYSPEFVPETSLLGRIQEKMAASRFLTYSLLVHVVLVALFGSIVVVRTMIPDDDFQAGPGLTEEGPIIRQDDVTTTVLPNPKDLVVVAQPATPTL